MYGFESFAWVAFGFSSCGIMWTLVCSWSTKYVNLSIIKLYYLDFDTCIAWMRLANNGTKRYPYVVFVKYLIDLHHDHSFMMKSKWCIHQMMHLQCSSIQFALLTGWTMRMRCGCGDVDAVMWMWWCGCGDVDATMQRNDTRNEEIWGATTSKAHFQRIVLRREPY